MSNLKKEQTQAASTKVCNPSAAEIIRNFTLFYPPDVAKEALWQLFNASISGTGADDSNAHDRSNMLLFAAWRVSGCKCCRGCCLLRRAPPLRHKPLFTRDYFF
jgi:hypothetical protein